MRHHHNATGLECNETQPVYAPASPDNKDKTKMKLTQT